MAAYSVKRIAELIQRGQDKSLATKVRGDAFEDLLCYFLEKLPGIKVRRNSVDRFNSAEIDISVANAQTARWMNAFPPLFMVECKNWDDPVDSKAVSAFSVKLTERYASLGIIAAANGITGNQRDLSSAYHRIAMAQQDGRRILVITLEQLKLVRTTQDFEDLLCESLLTVFASGEL